MIEQGVGAVLAESIGRRVCVNATYNRVAVVLAPHSLFERHGDLFLRAVTIEHDGRKPREARLGTFNAKGLSGLTPTRRLFSAALFRPLEAAAEA